MGLTVAIIGNGYVNYNTAAELLKDYLPNPSGSEILVPSYITGEGLKTVIDWLTDTAQPFSRVRKSEIIDTLLNRGNDIALIVLGIEGLEKEVVKVQGEKIRVYDLCRALDDAIVPDGWESGAVMPLDGSQSQSETLSGVAGGKGRVQDPQAEDGAESFVTLADVKRIVEEQLSIYFARHETNFHTGHESTPTGDIPNVIVEDESVRAKYYRDENTGKVRKAGKSRAKNGEKEVWLTIEEADVA